MLCALVVWERKAGTHVVVTLLLRLSRTRIPGAARR